MSQWVWDVPHLGASVASWGWNGSAPGSASVASCGRHSSSGQSASYSHRSATVRIASPHKGGRVPSLGLKVASGRCLGKSGIPTHIHTRAPAEARRRDWCRGHSRCSCWPWWAEVHSLGSCYQREGSTVRPSRHQSQGPGPAARARVWAALSAAGQWLSSDPGGGLSLPLFWTLKALLPLLVVGF